MEPIKKLCLKCHKKEPEEGNRICQSCKKNEVRSRSPVRKPPVMDEGLGEFLTKKW